MEPGGFDQATSSPNVFSSFGHAGGTNGDSWFQKFNHDDVFVTPDHLYTVVPKEENDADFQCPMVVWAAVWIHDTGTQAGKGFQDLTPSTVELCCFLSSCWAHARGSNFTRYSNSKRSRWWRNIATLRNVPGLWGPYLWFLDLGRILFDVSPVFSNFTSAFLDLGRRQGFICITNLSLPILVSCNSAKQDFTSSDFHLRIRNLNLNRKLSCWNTPWGVGVSQFICRTKVMGLLARHLDLQKRVSFEEILSDRGLTFCDCDGYESEDSALDDLLETDTSSDSDMSSPTARDP